MSFTATRYHDISCGHRVHGHESKCKHLHGHNYRVHFTCEASNLDNVGRVIDFSEMKSRLCMWIEENWDHKFLAWDLDPVISAAANYMAIMCVEPDANLFPNSIVFVPFNPTAENMAEYLVEVVGPEQLAGTGITLVSCRIEETAKCSATYNLMD